MLRCLVRNKIDRGCEQQNLDFAETFGVDIMVLM